MDYEKFKTLLAINIIERTTDDINAIVNLAYVSKTNFVYLLIYSFKPYN